MTDRVRNPKTGVSNYRRKRMHPVVKLFLLFMLAGTLCFGVLLVLVLSGSHDNVSGEPQVMIILGCKLDDWGPSVMLQDRLDKALEYLEDHPDITVVVSGGKGNNEPAPEAQGMADYLSEHGFSRKNIILETMSHNTWQNLTFTARHLRDEGIDISEEVVIVSNGFHLTQAKMLVGRAGFENVSTLAAPSSYLPYRLKMYIREPLALVKSFMFDR